MAVAEIIPEQAPAGEDPQRLVDRLRAGDADALEVLMARFGPPLLRLAGGFLHGSPDVADAVQETFIAAWRRIAGYRDGTDFEAWLSAICLNACRMRLRTHAREAKALRSLPRPPAQAPPSSHAEEAHYERLMAALGELPEREREAFVLMAVEGQGAERAGRIMGCSAASARGYLSRARKRLVERLEDLLEP